MNNEKKAEAFIKNHVIADMTREINNLLESGEYTDPLYEYRDITNFNLNITKEELINDFKMSEKKAEEAFKYELYDGIFSEWYLVDSFLAVKLEKLGECILKESKWHENNYWGIKTNAAYFHLEAVISNIINNDEKNNEN